MHRNAQKSARHWRQRRRLCVYICILHTIKIKLASAINHLENHQKAQRISKAVTWAHSTQHKRTHRHAKEKKLEYSSILNLFCFCWRFATDVFVSPWFHKLFLLLFYTSDALCCLLVLFWRFVSHHTFSKKSDFLSDAIFRSITQRWTSRLVMWNETIW